MTKSNLKSNSKKILIGIIIVLLIVILVLVENQLASANPSGIAQNATKSLLEVAQAQIDEQNAIISKDSNPTARAELEKGLNLYKLQATQLAAAETKVPTSWALKQTHIVQLTKPVNQTSPQVEKTRRYGLYPDFTNIYLDKKVVMAIGAWFDPLLNQLAITYYSGALEDTNNGVVIRQDERTYIVEEFILAETTGKITIIDKKGNFLVLKKENGDILYFNVSTYQFTLSMVGVTTPMPTLKSRFDSATPTPTSPAYPIN